MHRLTIQTIQKAPTRGLANGAEKLCNLTTSCAAADAVDWASGELQCEACCAASLDFQ